MPHGDPDEYKEEEERRREARAELLERIQETLEEYNHLESDIPIEPRGYWLFLNMYRSI